ncbi:hypothetical protein [Sphingomonas sp. CFBP8993]|uniref:hypothetical protein n=1 Tax=Sphingomonas sp. CFBP8993 TaxID=3096526 RepID=UPI002A6B2ADD|nr:hypothetical protein [Sphingomonas sp. CFBP8993]
MTVKYTAECKSFVTMNAATQYFSVHRSMGSVHRRSKGWFILNQVDSAAERQTGNAQRTTSQATASKIKPARLRIMWGACVRHHRAASGL